MAARIAAAALVATGTVFALAAAGGDARPDGYRVDAIFLNAAFLISGQDVKIAGAKVGTVEDVTLTADRKARIQMRVDARFAPFRADADCVIQPQSLIGEKFVQCDPGTPAGGALRELGGVATVPLSQTHSPVDLDLVLATFRQPTTTRAALLLSALGGGLAGRGEDLDVAIRQADPAFAEVSRLLGVVNDDRKTIRSLIAEADPLLDRLAARREDVADFVSGAAAATAPTARRRAELQQSIRELPRLLTAARPSLRELRRLAEEGTPVVERLGRAAPQAERLVRTLVPFSRTARPALAELGRAAASGRRAVRPAAPQIRRVRRLARAARPGGPLLAAFLESSRDNGAVEGVLSFVYYATAALARFDGVSHILPAYAQVIDACNLYATTTVPSCDAAFAASRGRTAGRRAGSGTRDREAKGGKDAVPSPAQRPARPQVAPPRPSAPKLPPVLGDVPQALQDTLDGLLKPPGGSDVTPGIDRLRQDLLDALGGRRVDPARPASSQSSLLDFLLGD